MSTRQIANEKYQQTRIGLLKRGTNIRRWSRAHGYHERSVYHAAKGNRHGALAYRIRQHLDSYINE